MPLSFEEISTKVSDLLDERFTVTVGEGEDARRRYAWPLRIYNTFLIARLPTSDGGERLVRIDYVVTGDDVVFVGEPREVEQKFLFKDTMEIAASRCVTGDEAAQLLADLQAQNPLFAALDGTPNHVPVVMDFTFVGKRSSHQGMQYTLAKAGLKAALPSLISKPIHISSQMNAHADRGMPLKPIGVFLGGVGIDEDDDTATVRAVGALWGQDFPAEVAAIKAQKAALGASYEIAFAASDVERLDKTHLKINKWVFTGGAILRRDAAAYPDTRLLVASAGADGPVDVMDEAELTATVTAIQAGWLTAKSLTTTERDALPDSDFALIERVTGKDGKERKVRRFPIHDEAHRKNAWARVAQAHTQLTDAQRKAVRTRILSRARREGDAWARTVKEGGATAMGTTYTGIPEEYHAIVAGLLAAQAEKLKAEGATAELQAQVKDLVAERDGALAAQAAVQAECKDMKEKMAKIEADLAAAQASLAETTARAEKAETELATARAEQAEAELTQKAEAEWQKLAAEQGFTDRDKGERLPIIKKLMAGQVVTLDETRKLVGGRKSVPTMTLKAGTGENGADVEALRRAVPAAFAINYK